MLWSSIILLLILCASNPTHVFARRWYEVTTKHSWLDIPRNWQHTSPAPARYAMIMQIGLKQPRMSELIENLMEISDPTHARYGQHLTKEQADAFMAPHSDSTAAANDWLNFHGIDPSSVQRSDAGDWITVPVTVQQAETMLNTKYHVYQHVSTGDQVVRTLRYSLPTELHRHVDVISPTTYFGTAKSMMGTKMRVVQEDASERSPDSDDATVPSSCFAAITPACLRTLYNTTTYAPNATNVNKLGIAGYLDEFANRDDLQTFFKAFRKDAVGSNFTTISVTGGGDNQTEPGVEANLDIQYASGMTFPTPNIYYSTGGSPPFKPDSVTPTNTNEPYLALINFLLAQKTIPQTLSTSYGDDEQTVPYDYARRVCEQLAVLGSRGTTVFYSSGDFGVGQGDCKTNDGTNTTLFQPAFPASCPYVTAVGATTQINPEVPADFSGGGFSRYFVMPKYQKTAVDGYLKANGSTNAGLFNPAGRAYPDLSAQGKNFQVVINGTTFSVDGTSASSPTVAAIFSLLNDYRLSKGKKPLGFINPLIYNLKSASAFNDIVFGFNPACGTIGFTARVGWDPVTGLGTPNFAALKNLV